MATVCGEIWRVRVSILPEATLHQPKSFHPSLLSLFLTIHFFSFFFFKFSSPHFLFFLSVCSTSFVCFFLLFVPSNQFQVFRFLSRAIKSRARNWINFRFRSIINWASVSQPARPGCINSQRRHPPRSIITPISRIETRHGASFNSDSNPNMITRYDHINSQLFCFFLSFYSSSAFILECLNSIELEKSRSIFPCNYALTRSKIQHLFNYVQLLDQVQLAHRSDPMGHSEPFPSARLSAFSFTSLHFKFLFNYPNGNEPMRQTEKKKKKKRVNNNNRAWKIAVNVNRSNGQFPHQLSRYFSSQTVATHHWQSVLKFIRR